jgi:hypothetical protein
LATGHKLAAVKSNFQEPEIIVGKSKKKHFLMAAAIYLLWKTD